MGREYYHRKAMAEESIKLSIYRLKNLNLLDGYHNTTMTWTHSLTGRKSSVGIVVDVRDVDEPYVKLNYTLTNRNSGNKTDYDYDVPLETTDCNFGGERYWFVCPSCCERAGVLYLPPGNEYFWCWGCHNLSYQSRNCSGMESLGITYRKIEKLQSQIKRWSYQSRPTRKVRKLLSLERKVGVLSVQAQEHIDKFAARLRRH